MAHYYMAETCLDGEYSIFSEGHEEPLALLRGQMASFIWERYSLLSAMDMGDAYLSGVISGLVAGLEDGVVVSNPGVEEA